MKYTLVGVKRGEFTTDGGDRLKYGHLFAVSDFDPGTEGVAGREAMKVKFDYDSVGDLLNLTYPIEVELVFNAKGKCVQVILPEQA